MKIANFRVQNFRSLRDVTVPGLKAGNVFHGANNSGKSNILLALKTIFSPKLEIVEASPPGEPPLRSERPTPFWYGQIKEFAGNFYMDTHDSINFSLTISQSQQELGTLPNAEILTPLLAAGHDVRINLSGRIERNGDEGTMFLDLVRINGKVALVRSSTGVEYLPKIQDAHENKMNLVRALLDSFTDAVSVIPSTRFLIEESSKESATEGTLPALTATTFKNWLQGQSLSRDGYETFMTIKRWFNEPPFTYGELSFLKSRDVLEIMVDDRSGYRMPIEAKGTGVQQILILLSFIAQSNAKIICVEEPELNLSFVNQDAVVNKLMSFVLAPVNGPFQLLLSSHSDHIGSRTDLQQYHVSQDGTGTSVRRFTSADRGLLFPRSRGKRPVTLI